MRLFLQVADSLETLAKLPDRVTPNDLENAATALRAADKTIEELQGQDLRGCTCHPIRTEAVTYLAYREDCKHHATLARLEIELRQGFEAARAKLEAPYRMQLFAAAMQGLLAGRIAFPIDIIVDEANKLVDEALAKLHGTAPP